MDNSLTGILKYLWMNISIYNILIIFKNLCSNVTEIQKMCSSKIILISLEKTSKQGSTVIKEFVSM